MNIIDVNKILRRYSHLPAVAIWKAIIVNEGVDSCLNKKDFEKKFNNYKIKYAVKSPISSDYKVLDRSADQRVIPSEVIIKDNDNNLSLLKLRYNPQSVINLAITGNNEENIKFYIKNKDKKVIIPVDISFVKEKGDSVVSLLGRDRLSINLFEGCWNWNSGCQCKFCDLSPKRKDYRSVVPSLNDLRPLDFDYELWWNKYKMDFFKRLNKSFKKMYKLAEPHKHLLIMSGGFIDNDFLWKMIIELTEELNRIIPLKKLDNYINVPPPTNNIKKHFLRLKSLGIKQMQINLEVANKKKFEKTCPGKNKTIGYDNYQKALKVAVTVFGRGKVRSNFVFTSHAAKELLDEAKRLAKLGVIMDYSIFQPKKGTPWSEKKGPAAGEILSFTEALAKIYKKHNFRGIYCNLSSRSSIINEVLNYKD